MARTWSLVTATVAVTCLMWAAGCVVRDPAPRTVVVAGATPPPEGGAVAPAEGTAVYTGGAGRGALAVCSSGQPCAFTCSPGGCDVTCQNGSTCESTCSGGGCNQTCQPGASCEFTCSGGGCNQTCQAGSACSTRCSGGGCNTMQ